MGRFATGVTVVTTVVGGEIFGMTANAFMAGSLSPPLCVVSIGRSTKMHDRLFAAGRFGVSILSEDQADLSQHFADRPVRNVVPDFRFHGHVPVLEGVGAVAAYILNTVECGDHTLFVGQIEFMQAHERQPLLFYGGRYAVLDREQRLDHTAPHSFW
jgi:flavin reductase (DIM6/NTAB) family NADH-FMN oxidoreductase RutF